MPQWSHLRNAIAGFALRGFCFKLVSACVYEAPAKGGTGEVSERGKGVDTGQSSEKGRGIQAGSPEGSLELGLGRQAGSVCVEEMRAFQAGGPP